MRFQTNKIRLDKALAIQLKISRSAAQTMIEKGQVLVNESVITSAKQQVTSDDRLSLVKRESDFAKSIGHKFDLEIVFEDQDVAVINKPKGISVHGGAGITGDTLVDILPKYFSTLSQIGGIERPGIVHRLDKDTDGLMIIAKTDTAHTILKQSLAERKIERRYIALCYGAILQKHGTIDTPYGRHHRIRTKMAVLKESQRNAITHYQVISALPGPLSLVELKLETGRTHQIRVHMAYIGHPIVGDQIYGKSMNFALLPEISAAVKSITTGQCLTAYKLMFMHPISNQPMRFELANLENPFKVEIPKFCTEK